MQPTPTPKGILTFRIVCFFHLLFAIFLTVNQVRSYYSYKSHEGWLYGESFLYVAAIHLIIIAGLIIMLLGRRFGFWIYLSGQIITYAYIAISGSVDAVLGLFILPDLFGTSITSAYYYKNLGILK